MLPDHEFHPLTVVDVVDETADTRSFVLEIPSELEATFAYAAGQYCTFRATIDGETVSRCYSMSSSPEIGERFTTAVKRVPGGRMSNWMNDTLAAGRHHRRDAPGRALRAPCDATRRSWRSRAAAASRRSSRSSRARWRLRNGPIALVYANRRRGRRHLRRRARAPPRGVRRPADRPPPPRFGTRLPRRRRLRGARRRQRARRLLHLRARPLHGHRRRAGSRRSASSAERRFIERFVVPAAEPRGGAGERHRVARDPDRSAQADVPVPGRGHDPGGRPACRPQPALLVRGGQLRHVHGPPRRGLGDHAREQRVGGRRGRRRLGPDVPVAPHERERSSSTTTRDPARRRAARRALRCARASAGAGGTPRCRRRTGSGSPTKRSGPSVGLDRRRPSRATVRARRRARHPGRRRHRRRSRAGGGGPPTLLPELPSAAQPSASSSSARFSNRACMVAKRGSSAHSARSISTHSRRQNSSWVTNSAR